MKTRLFPNTLRSSVATIVVVMLAACAGRSVNLNPPPAVVDWSTGTRAPVSSASAANGTGSSTAFYSVTRGDTLASIGTRFRVAPADLAAWNNLAPNARLSENQVLRLTPPGGSKPTDTNPVATTRPIGGESIEQRPIGTPSDVPVAVAPATSPNAPLKSTPLGLKRPYSDATFADMSRPDPDAPQATAPSPQSAAPSPPTPPPAGPSPAASSPAASSSSIAWTWPVSGRPLAAFDEKTKGIDIAGKAGDPVLAAADGKVTFAGTGVRGYGNFVIVQHSPELLSVYGHNRVNLVKEGETVVRGQKIAEMGASDADAVKLHFEIRRDSKPVDPLQFLPQR